MTRCVHWFSLTMLFLLVCTAGGCRLLGAAASALPAPKVQAAYKGLKNQSVAVMVWADRGIRTDFPPIQLDLSAAIQNKLKNSRAGELEGATFPWEARSVVRYQRDHPETEGMPATAVAPRISNVTRLIYVEVHGFTTQAENSLQLHRGSAEASLQVLEIANGKATVAYREDNIRAVFPPKSPPEGLPEGDPYRFYRGTVEELALQIANRFMQHEGDS